MSGHSKVDHIIHSEVPNNGQSEFEGDGELPSTPRLRGHVCEQEPVGRSIFRSTKLFLLFP
jgi:hypothetical protein